MKQQTIETGLCTLLLVELPEGVDSFMVHPTKINTLLINSDNNDVIAELPMWSVLIGRLPELTEDEAHNLIDQYEVSHNLDLTATYSYKDYREGVFDRDSDDYEYWEEYTLDNALESLDSLLEANGIVFENPLGKTHPHHPNYTGIAESVDGYLDRSDEWKEAQSKVFDKEKTYLFIKID